MSNDHHHHHQASNSHPSSSSSSQFTYSNGSYFPLPFHLQQSDSMNVHHHQQYPKPSYMPSPTMPLSMPPPPPQAKVMAAPMIPSVYSGPSPVPSAYTLPQYQQAQQLFQRDAQTITPEALESVKAALASSEIEHKAETKKKAIPRKAAGQTWEDPTLAEWPENDYRLFCGDLGNEVNDEVLSKAFSRFPTFNMARLPICGYAVKAVSTLRLSDKSCLLSPQDRELFVPNELHGILESGAAVVPTLVRVVRDKRTGKTRGFGFVSFANPLDLAAALKEMNGKYVGNRPIKLRKSSWKERTDMEAMERQKHQSHKKQKMTKKGILHK